MNGAEFFRMIIMTGMGFLGVTALLGIMRKRMMWDAAERAGMWLSLEVGVAAVLFALLPYPLTYTGADELFAWRFGSLTLVMYLAWHMIRIGLNHQRFGAQYPWLMIGLLAFSAMFALMEFINAIWWGSLAGYTWGVLWLLALTGVQLIAFVCYDRQPEPQIAAAYRNLAMEEPPDETRAVHVHYHAEMTRPTTVPEARSMRHPSGGYRYRNDQQMDAYHRSVAEATSRLTPLHSKRRF
jgi:hypothetical protein